MKVHTTNAKNLLVTVAEDCPTPISEIPGGRTEKKSVAQLQYEMLAQHPYQFTSDDVLASIDAARKDVPAAERNEARQLFFSKGQPCFRASPLTKRYGFGVHHNNEEKIALVPMESETYATLLSDEGVMKEKAMRSKRKS